MSCQHNSAMMCVDCSERYHAREAERLRASLSALSAAAYDVVQAYSELKMSGRTYRNPTIRKLAEAMYAANAALYSPRSAWARAIRERYECGAEGMSCGGVCHRPAGHAPPCYCAGVDENGEETCPA